MYRAQHRLTGSSELLQERNDLVRALTIQPTRWLVEEEKRRLGHQLDTDRQSLSLLDSETSAWNTDQSILDIVQLQEVDNLVDIGEFLGSTRRSRLSQECRKLQSFSNSGLGEVNVQLLAISGGTLEGDRECGSVQLYMSGDYPLTLPGSQDVHQSGLPSTG
jgi:hypothetical protein